MSGAIPPIPQCAFMAWCLVKHRDNFTFTFYVGNGYNSHDYKQTVNYTSLHNYKLIKEL
jgi:hypothetical protein